jgi:proline iminopeptidase
VEALTDEMLPVGDGHELCLRTYGTPGRVAVLFLHGGPGSGVQESHLALFDPATCHLVAFDQRGAGRSRPSRARHANTTQHLIADIEAIRAHLGLSAWMVVGGSWGATLALAYAEAHPDRVLGLVLRATFLGTRAELDWAFLTGPCHLHPKLHADFLGLLPEAERADPLPGYWRRILDQDPAVHLPFAAAWHDTERILSQHVPRRSRLDLATIRAAEAPGPGSPYMEAHYFSNGCFLNDRPILEGASRLAGIPAAMVQGRYDLLCPPRAAQALAAGWREARVVEVEAAGHALEHAPIRSAMTAEIARMIARLT